MNRLLLTGKILILMLVAMGGITSCDDDDDDDNQTKLTVETFMQQAAASDTFEITTGNMAAQKAAMSDVKTFGQMLVTDHTRTSKELKTLAKQKNITLPKTMPQEKMPLVTALQNQTGANFDKQFSQIQVDAHEEAINLFERAEDDITDADVKAFINKNLPGLRMHLVEAKRLEDMTD
jgi:putative membrane protein